MSNKKINTTEESVTKSVSSIYSELLQKRRMERDAKEEKKRLEREEKEKEKEEKKKNKGKDEDDERFMSKKERIEASMDAWKEIVVGLTGDDLEYFEEKKKKKKYQKWIDDDEVNTVLNAKAKKPKKKNYNKEFESELNMLKNLVADQNRFTNDLQRRYNIMAGPNTKDAMPLSKTQVDLASVINASRSNALGVLNAIGNVKKTIADLYMKQKKLDADLGGGGDNIGSTDLGLLGSNITASLLGDSTPINIPPTPTGAAVPPPVQTSTAASTGPVITSVSPDSNPDGISASSFDPSTWDGGPEIGVDNSILYESIPHDIVVELHKDTQLARFKAIRRDNGNELVNCPVPTVDPSKLSFDTTEMTVKGPFDDIYRLEIV